MKDSDLIRRSDVLKKTVWMETNVPTRVAPLRTEIVLVEDVRSIPAVDAVERESIINAKFPDPINDYATGWNDALDAVAENAPAVDADAVVHAWWEDANKSTRNPHGAFFNWWCARCKTPQHTPVAKNLDEFTKANPYCHWCGARMDGRREDGDA